MNKNGKMDKKQQLHTITTRHFRETATSSGPEVKKSQGSQYTCVPVVHSMQIALGSVRKSHYFDRIIPRISLSSSLRILVIKK